MNYYNEIDPYCTHWIYNLIQEKLIPPGHIDTRPIQDVRPRDLAPYTQCHFFAGVAGWPLALRLANISSDQPIWTGSCPCQPFSAAGKRRGFADERHLWPHWFHLISVCRPPVVVGEQVARASTWGWHDAVALDLESQDYAFASAVLPAASVGAPHRRDRLWFVAHRHGDASSSGRGDAGEVRGISETQCESEYGASLSGGSRGDVPDSGGSELRQQPRRRGRTNGTDSSLSGKYGANGSMADPDFVAGYERRAGDGAQEPRRRHADRSGFGENVRNTDESRLEIRQGERSNARAQQPPAVGTNWWAVEPDVGRVAHGVSARVAKLRALGNAIVPQVAAEFLRSAIGE